VAYLWRIYSGGGGGGGKVVVGGEVCSRRNEMSVNIVNR